MRLSQAIEYLNRKKHPTEDEIDTVFTHITINEDMKKLRRNYRGKIKGTKKKLISLNLSGKLFLFLLPI